MNTRGFTLVEIIAIMVILVSIFLVSFPALDSMLKSDEEKLYNTMVDDLCIAGKTYLYSNMNLFPELSVVSSEIEIEISELIKYGSVDKNLKNPKTDKTIENNKLQYTVLEDFSLDCKYIEE